MKAVRFDEYGPVEVLDVREVPVPEPGPGELLLRVGAATTCGTDVKVFRRGGHPRMLKVPSPFGHEMAGTVAAVGAGVSRFREGDRVAVANSAPCGRCRACLRGHENLCSDLLYLNGGFAEYLLVPPRAVERSVGVARALDEGLAQEQRETGVAVAGETAPHAARGAAVVVGFEG